MTTVSSTATPAGEDFVAYEYASVRAPRELEPLYQDTYRSFGWSVEDALAAGPVRMLPLTPAITPRGVTLRLKRDRAIRSRQMVQTLQRKAERSLATIARLEASPATRATGAAILVGILGAAALAGSIFTMNAGLIVVAVLLGAIGLLGWAAGFPAYLGVKNRRARAIAPLLDQEYDALYESSEQASRLLR